MNAMIAYIRSLAIALLVLFAGSGVASAHSALITASPPQDALLQTPPSSISLEFNESVIPLSFQLFAPDDTRTDLSDQVSRGAKIVLPLDGELEQGTYVLSWRVTSEDGHPIAGSLVFSIGRLTSPSAEALRLSDPAVQVLIGIAKAVAYVCLFGGVGAALFASLVAPLPRRTLIPGIGLAMVGLLTVGASLGLQGLDALGLSVDGFFNLRAWQAALDTSYGATAVLFIFALLFAAAALTHAGWVARVVAILSAASLGLAMASSGHASAADPQWLTRPAVFAHAIGIAFWVGSLAPLAVYLRSDSENSRVALERFSRLIPWAVAAVVLSGSTLIVIQMGFPSRQWLAPYGLLMLAKLLLLVLLFGLALFNRLRLTIPALAHESRAIRHLGLSVRAEIVVVIVILALVACLRFTAPPRVLSQIYPDPAYVELTDGTTRASVLVDPGRPGLVSVNVAVTDANGPIAASAVTASFRQPEIGIEPITRDATDLGNGYWRVDGLMLPVQGVWDVTLDVRLSRFSQAQLHGKLTIESLQGSTRPPTVVASIGPLQIADPFSRATLPAAPIGGAYFVVFNTGETEDVIVSATTPIAGEVTAHDMQAINDIMRMRQLTQGIVIPAGQAVRLEPVGLNLMLEPLAEPLVEGTTFPLTVTFKNAGSVTFDVPVLGITANGVAGAASGS